MYLRYIILGSLIFYQPFELPCCGVGYGRYEFKKRLFDVKLKYLALSAAVHC